MKILIVGAKGQLGWELGRTCPDLRYSVLSVDYPEIDICDKRSVKDILEKHRPCWLINCAAYTDVDGAEIDKTAAYAVNCQGAVNLAEAALEINARMVHISTDFVFSGNRSKPYLPYDTPAPCSVYGQTKLEGEKGVRNVLGENTLIIRTAWLYSSHGRNFVHTMIRLMKEKQSIGVVDDQIGTPCWAKGLAETIWISVKKRLKGIFHWTDAGVASWYDFAVAIEEEAFSMGLIKRKIPIIPIPTEKYPLPAKRPDYSVLNKTSFIDAIDIVPQHWQRQLRMMLKEL